MAFSQVDIYNMALSAVGTSATVSEVSELSREAENCNRWYDLARDTVLGAAPWPSALEYKRLAQVAERDKNQAWVSADPSPAFTYAFAQPVNLIKPYHLQSFRRFEYRRGRISCEEPDPILFYVSRNEDVSSWQTELVSAVVHALAAKIAPQYKGDENKSNSLLQKAMLIAEDMAVAVANKQDQHYATLPDWIQARGYEGGTPVDRYFYPFDAQNIGVSL